MYYDEEFELDEEPEEHVEQSEEPEQPDAAEAGGEDEEDDGDPMFDSPVTSFAAFKSVYQKIGTELFDDDPEEYENFMEVVRNRSKMKERHETFMQEYKSYGDNMPQSLWPPHKTLHFYLIATAIGLEYKFTMAPWEKDPELARYYKVDKRTGKKPLTPFAVVLDRNYFRKAFKAVENGRAREINSEGDDDEAPLPLRQEDLMDELDDDWSADEDSGEDSDVEVVRVVNKRKRRLTKEVPEESESEFSEIEDDPKFQKPRSQDDDVVVVPGKTVVRVRDSLEAVKLARLTDVKERMEAIMFELYRN